MQLGGKHSKKWGCENSGGSIWESSNYWDQPAGGESEQTPRGKLKWLEDSLHGGWRGNIFSSWNTVTKGNADGLRPYFREHDSHRFLSKEYKILLLSFFFSLFCSFHKYLLRPRRSQSWDVSGKMRPCRQEGRVGAEGGETHRARHGAGCFCSFPHLSLEYYPPCSTDEETEVQGGYVTCHSSPSTYMCGALRLILSSVRLFVLQRIRPPHGYPQHAWNGPCVYPIRSSK